MRNNVFGLAIGLSLTAGAVFAASHETGVAGDAASGEKVFRKCTACHAVGADAKNKVGPVLNGVVGRAAASVEDFGYSKAMEEKAAEGLMWTPETLDTFLAKPREYVSGTKMAFPGLRKDDERADVIAYLATITE